MNDSAIQAMYARKDLLDTIDLLSDTCNKIDRLDCSINLVVDSESISDSDKIVYIKKAIDENLSVIDKESIDFEKIDNLDLESIKDKVSLYMGEIRNLFKSTRQKLFEAIDNTSSVWVKENGKRINDLYLQLDNKVDTSIDSSLLAKANKAMGNALSTIRASDIDINQLIELAKAMTSSFKVDYSSDIDDKASKLIRRKDTKIVGSDIIKVTRVDSNALSYIVVGEEFGIKGIRYYDSIKIKNTDSVLTSKNMNIEYARECLYVANTINELLPKIGESIRLELANVEDSVKDVTDKAKWATSGNGLTIGTLSGYVAGAILVGFGIYAGGLPIAYNLAKMTVANSISALSTIVKGYMKLAPKTKAYIGATAISTSIIAPKIIANWFNSIFKDLDKNDDYYQGLEDKARVKLLNARVEMTTRYSLDAVYGMYFLVLELMSTASIIMEHLENKGDQDEKK